MCKNGSSSNKSRWIYTNKEINDKQIIKTGVVTKGFQDIDADNIRNMSLYNIQNDAIKWLDMQILIYKES